MHHPLPIQFLMLNPTHAGNIGSAARAIKTMGFHQLSLVLDPASQAMVSDPQAVALASSADDVLSNATIYTSFNDAIANSTLVIGLTARPRDKGPKAIDVRAMCELITSHIQSPNTHMTFVFGTERHGMSNDELLHCHRLCYIPANPHYSSLNISSAIQLVAWEAHYALMQGQIGAFKTKGKQTEHTPTHEDLEGLINHWESMMTHCGFYHPNAPKQLMQRIRQFFMRSDLSYEEVQIFRGICNKIMKLK
ncbi:MAG: RNA methyltransferase [Alcaligenaceae bacterium]|nr:RNA methyltransferase [Alcaligenaceae bacterium]